jgi:hypothetical protein
MVCDRHYVRRCRECWHTESFQLPPLDVCVLYLDQNFFSNVLRELDPSTSDSRRARLNREGTGQFFRTAFEKIDRLVKLHLLICPDSPIHYYESVVSEDFEKFKRLYELLSHGVSFWRPEQIRNGQLRHQARAFIGDTDESCVAPRDHVVFGRLNVWRDWLQISLDTDPTDGFTGALRNVRSKKSAGFEGVWALWRDDVTRNFDDWYKEERQGLSKVLKQTLAKMMRNQTQGRLGVRQLAIEDALPDNNERLLFQLYEILGGENRNPEDFKRVWGFLESNVMDEIPTVRISSLIFAALAQHARYGQKCPKKHPFNDINAIAAYLPYCDAMFLDKEMQSILCEDAVAKRLGFSTSLFSLRRKSEFLEYLDSLEARASHEHMEKVREVFGDNCDRPYVEVLQPEHL